MSLEEWAALPEDSAGEIVDGQLVEEEDVGYAHEVIVGWLVALLSAWVTPRGGIVATSDARFGVSPARGRKPDLTVYLPGSRKPPPRGLVKVPPDIAIEIVSPTPRDGRRDRVEKMKEYAAFGIRWYWIVDPGLRTFEIHELGSDGRYAYALGVSEGTVASVPGCEGLTLDVDAMWHQLSWFDAEGIETPEE
jgi:Uma2 family endonuclease